MPDVPIDRGWAWIALLGAGVTSFFFVGGLRSLGILLVEIVTRFRTTSGMTSLIMAIMSLCVSLIAPVSTSLGERLTFRCVIMAGGALCGLGCLLTGVVGDITQVILAYGILTGVGYGCIAGPNLVVVGRYFNRHRALANGLAVSGGSLGQLAIPLLLRYLLDEYGFTGGMVIYGALSLHIIPAALLMRPFSFYKTKPVPDAETLQILQSSCDITESSTKQAAAENAERNGFSEVPKTDDVAEDVAVHNYLVDVQNQDDNVARIDCSESISGLFGGDSSEILDTLTPSSARDTTSIERLEIDEEAIALLGACELIQLSPMDITADCSPNEDSNSRNEQGDSLDRNSITDFVFGSENYDTLSNDYDTCADLPSRYGKLWIPMENLSDKHAKVLCTDDDSAVKEVCQSDGKDIQCRKGQTARGQMLSLKKSLQLQVDRQESNTCGISVRSSEVIQHQELADLADIAVRHRDQRKELDECKHAFLINCCCCCVKPDANSPPPLMSWHMFREPLFVLYIVAISFGNSGYMNVCLFLPAHAEEDVKMTRGAASWLISIMGFVDLVGRIGGGWVADLGFVSRSRILAACLLVTGASTLVYLAVQSQAALIGLSVVMGLFGGCCVSLQTVVLVDFFGAERLASTCGLSIMCQGLINVFTPSLLGILRDHSGSYAISYFICAAFMIVSATIFSLETCVRTRRCKK